MSSTGMDPQPGGTLRGLERAGVVVVSAAGMAGYYCHLHREGRRWGATDEELRATLPGDDLVQHPNLVTTHAVTIHAPGREVWPWLVQMGYGRAGWYTDDWWYRQVGRYLWHVRTARTRRIIPALQDLSVEDIVLDGPPGTAFFTVAELESSRTLALYSTTHATVWLPPMLRDNARLGLRGELSWVFVLREEGPEQTRLILRSRTAVGPALYRALAKVMLPPVDLLVAPMMLQNIRQRVQQAAAFRDQDELTARGERLPRFSVPASRAAH